MALRGVGYAPVTGREASRDLIVTENITVDSAIDATGDWFVPAGAEGRRGSGEGHRGGCSSSRVRLEDGVRIDRHLTDHVLDGRQLISLAQQPEVERLAHLVDELTVRRHPEWASMRNSITQPTIQLTS